MATKFITKQDVEKAFEEATPILTNEAFEALKAYREQHPESSDTDFLRYAFCLAIAANKDS